MSEAANKYFEQKALRKTEKRIKSEKLELQRLGEKYEPRPFPIQQDPGVAPGDKPFMSIDQMVRWQVLKLEFEYKPLRDAGKTHDEAEQEVFPEAYQFRKDREAAQEAFIAAQEAEKNETNEESK